MTLRSTLALLVMLVLLAFSGPACALACAANMCAAKPGCCERSHQPVRAVPMAASHACGEAGRSSVMSASHGAMSVVAGLPGSCSNRCADEPIADGVAEAVQGSYAHQPGVGHAPELVALPAHELWSHPQPQRLRIRTALPTLRANLRV